MGTIVGNERSIFYETLLELDQEALPPVRDLFEAAGQMGTTAEGISDFEKRSKEILSDFVAREKRERRETFQLRQPIIQETMTDLEQIRRELLEILRNEGLVATEEFRQVTEAMNVKRENHIRVLYLGYKTGIQIRRE